MSGGVGTTTARRFCCCLAVAAPLLFLAPLASAQDMDGFRSPTGNIQCVFFDDESVRCNIAEKSTPLPPRPQDCELDWGNDFGLDETSGRGELLCVGDTIAGGYPVLEYGETEERGSLSCNSEQSGVTCTNGRGAGFTLSRRQQRLF